MTFDTSDPSDEQPWPDQQKYNDKDKYNDRYLEWLLRPVTTKKTMTMTMTLREHPQRAILESCDLRLNTWDTDYIFDNWEQQF